MNSKIIRTKLKQKFMLFLRKYFEFNQIYFMFTFILQAIIRFCNHWKTTVVLSVFSEEIKKELMGNKRRDKIRIDPSKVVGAVQFYQILVGYITPLSLRRSIAAS